MQIVELQSELARDILVEDLGDRLHLEIMVTRPERAHLAALAFLGAIGDVLGLRATHLPAFLDPREIAFLAESLGNRPAGATFKHRLHLERVEGDRALAAKACGNLPGQGLSERFRP